MGIKITICTPTYNRGYLLKNLYRSLIKQSFKEFEWIIVDDGSSDDTFQIVKEFEKDNLVNINYIYKKNGGKHTALNEGIKNAGGELFFIVDSDDVLVKDCLEIVWETWDKIDNKNYFAGIAGARGYSKSKMIGNTFNGDSVDATYIDFRFRMNVTGDKAEVYKTSIIKENMFPIFKGERFLTEAVVWNRIANLNLKLRWINRIIYITEYLDGGLTDNYEKLMAQNWNGTVLYYRELINSDKLSSTIKYRIIKNEFCRYLNVRDKGLKEITKLTNNPIKIIFIAFILYVKEPIKKIIRR